MHPLILFIIPWQLIALASIATIILTVGMGCLIWIKRGTRSQILRQKFPGIKKGKFRPFFEEIDKLKNAYQDRNLLPILDYMIDHIASLRKLSFQLGFLDQDAWNPELDQVEKELLVMKRVILNEHKNRICTHEQLINLYQYSHNFTKNEESNIYMPNQEYYPPYEERMENTLRMKLKTDLLLRQYVDMLRGSEAHPNMMSTQMREKMEEIRNELKFHLAENHLNPNDEDAPN